MNDIVKGIAAAHGIKVEFLYKTRTNMTINSREQTLAAAKVASSMVGSQNVDSNCEPKLFSEDFSQMLMVKPGCFILIGNGLEGSHAQSLHSSNYNFNDELLVIGSTFWSELVMSRLS